MNTDNTSPAYEVLSPWAEADPVPFRGLSTRLDKLDGKKIGLLRTSKRTSEPSLKIVADRLKKRYPTISISWFANLKANERVTATDLKEEFEKWIKGVDAVIASYGD